MEKPRGLREKEQGLKLHPDAPGIQTVLEDNTEFPISLSFPLLLSPSPTPPAQSCLETQLHPQNPGLRISSMLKAAFDLEELTLIPGAVDKEFSQEPNLVLHLSRKYLLHHFKIY